MGFQVLKYGYRYTNKILKAGVTGGRQIGIHKKIIFWVLRSIVVHLKRWYNLNVKKDFMIFFSGKGKLGMVEGESVARH
ncbi:hypothetical protein [Sporolactobacillus putidus]|uniref:Uncharacterized protein n=1 Tax=Sporolactobacillus putidus TaxID=492735 RepID=A0A917S0R2_9BACL|nr:hypothetical protein [Sporolactobacillus putidus]GGL48962.1 hypothetical protein GCM10007968_11370 [Sporolactobacillus putidus]